MNNAALSSEYWSDLFNNRGNYSGPHRAISVGNDLNLLKKKNSKTNSKFQILNEINNSSDQDGNLDSALKHEKNLADTRIPSSAIVLS